MRGAPQHREHGRSRIAVALEATGTQQEWITSMINSSEKALISAPFCFSGRVNRLSIQSQMCVICKFHGPTLRYGVLSPMIDFIS